MQRSQSPVFFNGLLLISANIVFKEILTELKNPKALELSTYLIMGKKKKKVRIRFGKMWTKIK